MNINSQQDVLKTSQMLADRGEFEQALACVETMNCVIGEWLKGKIYLDSALQMSNSFVFKHYPTMEIKSKYQNMLNAAYNHLYNAGQMLPDSTDDIKNRLNKCLWNQIAQVENKLAATRVTVEEDDDNSDMYEGDDSYYQRNAENLIDDISEWTF